MRAVGSLPLAEERGPLGLELLVGEQARVVQVLELAAVLEPLEIGIVDARVRDPAGDEGGRERDEDREPGGHRVGPGHRPAGEGADDEPEGDRGDERGEHEVKPKRPSRRSDKRVDRSSQTEPRAEPAPPEDGAASVASAGASASATSSRRSSLISSRSFAAYSNRSSSAAANISSSSWMASFSSSLRSMPSTWARPRRRRPGTVGCSRARNSAMSDTPLTIDSGVIPCSSLYASCTRRRRSVSSSAPWIASV